jgi:hypothetical protein
LNGHKVFIIIIIVIIIIIIIIIIIGVGLSPLGTAATSGLLYKPQMIDEGDYGAIGGLKIGKGNGSTQRKPAPAPLCPRRKVKPLLFSVPAFALSYAVNMFILMILYNFCMLPAQFCDIIVCIQNVESHMQITDWCAP